ncbi:MAG: hypothetical protein ACFFC6_12630 [Promethearchaeota archaeon]
MFGKKKIEWIDPHTLFPKGVPYGTRLYKPSEHSDKTEIGMTNYLEILPSVALYGFRYAIVANRSHRVLNGDFRVMAARELGLKIPVYFHNNLEGYPRLVFAVIRRIRRLTKKHSFLFRRFKNPEFKYGDVLLLCKFQKNIFFDREKLQKRYQNLPSYMLPYGKRLEVDPKSPSKEET